MSDYIIYVPEHVDRAKIQSCLLDAHSTFEDIDSGSFDVKAKLEQHGCFIVLDTDYFMVYHEKYPEGAKCDYKSRNRIMSYMSPKELFNIPFRTPLKKESGIWTCEHPPVLYFVFESGADSLSVQYAYDNNTIAEFYRSVEEEKDFRKFAEIAKTKKSCVSWYFVVNRGSTYHVVDTNNPAVRYEFEANLKRYVLGFLGTKIKTIEDFIEEEKSLHRRRPSAERDAEFQLRDSQGVPLEESEEFMLEIYDSERDNDNDKEDDYETEFGYIEAFKLTSDSYSLHGSMGHGATFGFKVVDKIAYLTHNGGYACMGTDEFELQTVVEPGIPTKEGRIQIHYAEDGNVLLSQWNGDVYFYCEWIKSSLGILSTDCSEEDIRWAKPLKLVIKRVQLSAKNDDLLIT
ncbi:hypothetical protein IWW45_002635 [Coemansia sp. RSA 485]|nr:hypothetical protein IWW45_002635 [Coemansia sp. RSA 485]